MKLKLLLSFILFASFVPAAEANPFSRENDPNHFRQRVAGVAIVAGTVGVIWGVQKYLNWPTRIANKYRKALQTYQANKNKDVIQQYELLSKTVAISYHTLSKDLARLNGQEETLGVPELKTQLVELQQFVYDMNTYLLEKNLNSRVSSLQRVYGSAINASHTAQLARTILGKDGSLYPLTNFEQTLIDHMYDLELQLFKVTGRSHNAALVAQAQILYQELRNLLAQVRALPEFRAEQKERERARQEEERERRRLQVEEEKLRIARLKLAAELAKSQNPQVVIVNNNNQTAPANNEHNPYLAPSENPYINSPEGYYWPPKK